MILVIAMKKVTFTLWIESKTSSSTKDFKYVYDLIDHGLFGLPVHKLHVLYISHVLVRFHQQKLRVY